MNSNNINALTGTTDKKSERKSGSPADGSAFSAAFDEASGDSAASSSKKAELVDRKETDKDKAAKEDDKKKADQAQDQKAQKDSKNVDGRKVDARVTEYVKSMERKDPATLSLAERQAFRLGEFSNQKQSTTQIAQMLSQQGFDLQSFSPQQMSSLLSRIDTQEVSKMLGQLKSDPSTMDEAALKNLKEQATAATQNKGKEAGAQFSLDALVASGMPKEAGESSRAEQRRQVLDQILSHIEVRNVANQTEMNLRLNPEYLGEVKIKLIHTDDGGISAKFQTTSKVTRDILSQTQGDLLDEARDKGVRIGSMDVELVDEIET